MSLPPQFLEELRSRLSVSEVVMKRMRLQRAGREFKAPCPFHNEKTPSFYVNDQKNFFHCLAGETGVLVPAGVVPIASLAGGTHRVLTRGGVWVEAAFKSYGVQPLLRIQLTRNGVGKDLFATDGHRWFVRGVQGAVLTCDLRLGHRLEAVIPAQEDWVVQSAEPTERVEEVFCAEVPEHNAFVLEDNILTGNCFGCGAHGDQIGFVMRYDNLSFMEAVENLAGEVGMSVPKASPQDRERFERQKSLYDLVERAAKYFEHELYAPGGRTALDYLRRRGLNDEGIARFRLGYAPQEGAALRAILTEAGYSDADMIEVGLFKRPEAGRAIRNFFWNRVMFPVTDRRGQVVAFGGRVLEGDGPKYINSAENPLFHKGNLLYGMSRARQAAADGQKLIVTEGYMDVIASVQAGFEGAVAPLGTAMTETQIQVLWKLAPEGQRNPILCFDGDNAGRRAAQRAIDRVLPILTPDVTVRIAFMPEKEDPDSLIRSGGKEAFQAILDKALSLEDFIWELVRQGENPRTADGRLRIEGAINQMMESVADKSVQYSYRSVLREKLRAAIRASGGGGGPFTHGAGPGNGRPRRLMPGEVPVSRLWDSRFRSHTLRTEPRRRERYLLLTILYHPELFQDVGEILAGAEFGDSEMEALRQALVACLTSDSGLDAGGLSRHLSTRGFHETLDSLLSADAPKFAQPGASIETAKSGWQEVWLSSEDGLLQRELREAERRFAETFSEDDLARLRALQRELLILRGHADELTELGG